MRRALLSPLCGLCGLVCCALSGCGASSTPIEPTASADAPLEVELRANRIVFNHAIRFEHDSDTLLDSARPVLDRVIELLASHETIIRVQVQGHTSTDGDTEHNQTLSARRAATVASYLSEHGVAQEVTSQGYGETYPLCHDNSPECHERNRRVEFFVDER